MTDYGIRDWHFGSFLARSRLAVSAGFFGDDRTYEELMATLAAVECERRRWPLMIVMTGA